MLDETGTTTAAPEAPAGSDAGAAEAPPASSTQSAIDAARDRLSKTGSMLPEEEEGGAKTEELDDKGRSTATETDEQKAAREAEEAKQRGEETAEQKAAREAEEARRAAETPEQKEAREAEEARRAAETPEQKLERERVEAEAAKERTVELPGLEERGEEPIDLELPDKETAVRIQRLKNDAAIGRQVKMERRAIERENEKIDVVEDQLTTDPAGFILDRVEAGTRVDVAMQLLFAPGVIEAIDEKLKEQGSENGLMTVLDNPDAQRVLKAELKSSRYELREKLRAQADERKAVRAAATKVATQIESLIPDSVEGEKRSELFNSAMNDLSERCRRLRINNLDPEDVMLLVGNKLRAAGIQTGVQRPAGNGDGKPAAKPPVTGPTAEQIRKAQERKAGAAAAAPAGAVAPAAKPRPAMPKTDDGNETEAAISTIRKVGGLRAALGKP